ncbi:MAG TPA: YihY family inner membrane protein [Halioglobus sp.]
MTFSHRMFRELWRRAHYLVRRYDEDRCSENAAALTYKSLFALVPLLTVMYTLASAIPTFQGAQEQMQALLFRHLVPSSTLDLQQYLNDFSQQARNLTGAGIAFLVVTAILMLRNIEHAFNMIWRARENRSAVSSFLLYWSVLTLAPFTIGLALGLSTYLSSFAHAVEKLHLLGANIVLVRSMPLLLSTTGFSLLYAAVPNCRVHFTHALIGGFFAAAAFLSARALFTQLVAGSSISFIYGAFAAVPLFLLWLYVSWNIVLMGGILVHSLSAYQNEEQANRPAVLKALDVLHVFWEKQQAGKVVREIELLDGRHAITRGLDSETWGEVRDLLIRKNVIAENNKGHYLLSRDLRTIPFWQLKEWIDREYPFNERDATREGWQGSAYRLLLDQRKSEQDILGANLVELFNR